MKKDKFKYCLYYEVQDSGNQDISTKEQIDEWNFKPLIFNSIEEAIQFRTNNDRSNIEDDYFIPEDLKYCGIRVYEGE